MPKLGRPAWQPTPEIIKEIENLASRQLAEYQIADCLGIHRDTFSDKSAKNPGIKEAIQRGKTKGTAFVVNKLFEKIAEGAEKSIHFYLKCKSDWRENDPLIQATIPILVNVDGKRYKIGTDEDDG